jgi:cytochrome c553
VIRLALIGIITVSSFFAQDARRPAPAADGAAASLPDTPGKAVVLRVCTRCHGAAAFAQLRMSRAEWQSEVNSMVARGATGTRRELRMVVDYLAKNLPLRDASRKTN